MKRIILSGIVAVSCMPAFASAIVVNTSASSHTGGVSVGAGETSVTHSSSASAEVQTIIRSDSGGGTADVQITTSQNGVTHTETKQYNVPAGGAIDIRTATSVGTVSTTQKTQDRAMASTTGRMVSDIIATSAKATIQATPKSLAAWLNQAPQSVLSLIARIMSALWW